MYQPTETSISLPVKGMTCASCASRIERVIGKLPGIGEANVNLATEHADISFDPSAISPVEISTAIVKAGFTVPPQSYEIAIEGMTCASCSGRVEKALKKLEGVNTAEVNLATEKATITVVTGVAGPADLIRAVEKPASGRRLSPATMPGLPRKNVRPGRAAVTIFWFLPVQRC